MSLYILWGGHVWAEELIIHAETSLEWNQKQGFYEAIGEAHAQQGEQEIFADRLIAYYDIAAQTQTISKIMAMGNVRFTDAQHQGFGERLTYEPKTQFYMLGGDARLSGPDGTARAQKQIRFYRQEGRAELKGGEVILADGRTLKGDEITLYFDAAEQIEKMDAAGHVKLTQNSGRIATADKAHYSRDTDMAVLLGNVTLREGENLLQGGRAEMNFTTSINHIVSDETGKPVIGYFTKRD